MEPAGLAVHLIRGRLSLHGSRAATRPNGGVGTRPNREEFMSGLITRQQGPMTHSKFTFIFALAASAALSTRGIAGTQSPSLEQALAQWRAAHGSEWRMEVDHETNQLKMLYGGHASMATHPRTDAEFIALAQTAVAQTAPMHGIDASTLVVERAQFLPLGQVGSGDKETVRLREEVNGIPVVNGYVNVLFSTNGTLLSVQSTGLPHLAQFSTVASLSADGARSIAAAAFANQVGIAPTSVSTPALVIEQLVSSSGRAPRLAWQVDAEWRTADTQPEGFTYWIDAHDGSVLRRASSIHNDVSGTVTSFSSPGLKPDEASNPAVAQPMPYLKVTSSAGTVFTDNNGNFNYPGVNAPLAVTVQFSGGQRCNVSNQTGANYTLTQTLQPNQSNSIVMNSPAAASVTSQANALRCTAQTSNYIHSINPTDTHADFSALAKVNENSTCNAFFDGSSINFFNAGGGCPNTAYSTVNSHEFGHWMNVLYGTGNANDGMGEGNADVWALYIWDTPINGQDFFGPGTIVRTGLNMTQFCGDTHPGCHGEVHLDGEVWMGAAWKVRANLENTYGQAPGGLIASNLFMGWMNGYNQMFIQSIIETQWLTLDDDDGNLSNGTPHYAQIDAAFRVQGFPGVNIICPSMSNFCTAAPNSASPTGATISAQGSQSVSANNFTVICQGVPPGNSGLFFYGQNAVAQTPFGNGFRCVGNPLFRLPATSANIFGTLTTNVDMTQLPPGGQISYAQTWNFQGWYRDPAAGGANYNASDALSVPFCP
jgi:hypothetical protein